MVLPQDDTLIRSKKIISSLAFPIMKGSFAIPLKAYLYPISAQPNPDCSLLQIT
jgi:hypothetical protein